MQTLIDFYNSPLGRKLVNWGVTAFGALITCGVLPLETAIGPFTLGQIITVIGLRLPSVSTVGPSAQVPTIKGTGA